LSLSEEARRKKEEAEEEARKRASAVENGEHDDEKQEEFKMAEGNVHHDSRNEGYLIRKHTMDGPHKKASNRSGFLNIKNGTLKRK
jgi:hypothetical protein